MLDEQEFRRWREAAADALAGARTQRDARSFAWACFLAEQAAQLGVKAWLHGAGLGPHAWGHDLPELGRRLAEQSAAPLAVDVGDALKRLSRHYIASRYPDAHPGGTPGGHYSAADADQALGDAVLVLAEVDRRWEQLGR